MQNKCYRASINAIPKDQSKLKSSSIPFFFSVEFMPDGMQVPVISEPLVRCEKCKGYLNPFVEIINPGYKWKCNLCSTVNEVGIPFQMKDRKTCENSQDPFVNSAFNKTYFLRPELCNELYDIEAPDSFNVATPDPPIICFLVDISAEAMSAGIASSVMHSAKEALRSFDGNTRTKIALLFFNESVYLFNNNNTFTVVNGEVPLIQSDAVLFTLDSDGPQSFFAIDIQKIEKYFEDRRSRNMDYVFALEVCAQAFRSAMVLSFISTFPSVGQGKLEPSTSLICSNSHYKDVAESLIRKNICCNLFVMTRSSVEFSATKIPSQYTGGQIFHYANYDGSDTSSASKFYCDICDFLAREMNFGAVCRIRANEGIVLKSAYGNFYQKGADLLSYSNYNPAHNINFTIQFYNDVKVALYLQIAMARVVKSGSKLIRIMNICIPVGGMPFYESCDAYAIAHCLALEAAYYESRRRGGGNAQLESSIHDIWKEVKTNHGRIPESLCNLPTYVLALMKSIPYRPDQMTPADFRGYYMYLLSNSQTKIVDLLIYPLLLNICSENVVPLPLTLQSVDQSGLYILDTGVNIFFYIGKNCDASTISSLFRTTADGPFVFNPPENEFSKYAAEWIVFLTNGRKNKPRFILANGQAPGVYTDIFFRYMFEDSLYQLPSTIDFRNLLESRNK